MWEFYLNICPMSILRFCEGVRQEFGRAGTKPTRSVRTPRAERPSGRLRRREHGHVGAGRQGRQAHEGVRTGRNGTASKIVTHTLFAIRLENCTM